MTAISTDEPRWGAILRRDREADGTFWYAVRTTGIYCRPSCPSRMPNRENVEFFATCDEAERRGFRACKRCRPRSVVGTDSRDDVVVLACRSIEAADVPPALDALAGAAGLSPSHFHRRFKAATGVTPKGYASAVRARKLREGLARGAPVAETIHAAGFGSSGRFYEGADAMLGMMPTDVKRGGRGLVIRHTVAPCSLGWVLVAATDRGICWLELGDSPEALRGQLAAQFPKADFHEGDDDLASRVSEVLAFLETPGRGLDLPLDIRGTAFQRQVWEALRAIPAGETASYTEVARRIGRPSAVRAVARACATNPIGLAIPCHRVLRGDGHLGGFRWGIERKRALLDREAGRASPTLGLLGDQAANVVEDNPGGE